jgi:hypothetical protein
MISVDLYDQEEVRSFEPHDQEAALRFILDSVPAAVMWPDGCDGDDVSGELYTDRFDFSAALDADKNRRETYRQNEDLAHQQVCEMFPKPFEVGYIDADPESFIYLSQQLLHNFVGPRPQRKGG